MKRKVNKKASLAKLRQRAHLYQRLMLGTKLIPIILLIILIFSKYSEFIRNNLKQYTYDCLSNIGFKLEQVLIEGQKKISYEEIFKAINADTGIPIFLIKPNIIKSELEKNKWVKTAVVERRLPNTLYIGLIEKVPVAIWQNNQKLSLIDEDGIKICNYNINEYSNLIHVVGDDANIYATKLLADLSIYPKLMTKVVSAVRYGKRRWNLNLQQNISIMMPDNNFDEALNYLNKLYLDEKLFNQSYKTLDLRNSSKYFIERYK